MVSESESGARVVDGMLLVEDYRYTTWSAHCKDQSY